MLSFSTFFGNRRFFASAFLYACFSLIFSTWVTYIPYIADKLELREAKIGGALFFIALGSLLMTPVTNRLVDRVGVGRLAFYGFLLYAVSLYGMFLATGYSQLCIALFFFGVMSSVFAISLNSLTARVEKLSGQNIMSGSHGFWSLGGMTGAFSGSFIAAWLHRPLVHITLLLFILVGMQLALRKEYFYVKSEPFEKKKGISFPLKPLILISALGIIMMVSEGAIADWSALYMKKVVLVEKQFYGFGYALFSLGMTLGRFAGDTLSHRFGSWKLMRMATGASLIGFLFVLLVFPVSALLGFLIIGIGFSITVPEVYRLASRVPGLKTADGVSFIAATANMGYLAGPVILGFIAQMRNLHTSFFALTGIVGVAWLITLTRKITRD